MEYFYTFLTPLVLKFNDRSYFCWGYYEVNDEVIGFSATEDLKTNWIYSTFYREKELVEEFKKQLPEKLIKRKRKK